jgi:hypothetical protein
VVGGGSPPSTEPRTLRWADRCQGRPLPDLSTIRSYRDPRWPWPEIHWRRAVSGATAAARIPTIGKPDRRTRLHTGSNCHRCTTFFTRQRWRRSSERPSTLRQPGESTGMNDSGPGYPGSPDDYQWILHTPDPRRRRRRMPVLSLVLVSLLSIAVGHFMDLWLSVQIGLLLLPVSVIWSVDILCSESEDRPPVVMTEASTWPALRCRPTRYAAILTTLAFMAPTAIPYGWTNNAPEALIAGLASAAGLAISALFIPVIRSSYLYFEHDSIRVTSMLYERRCRWDDIQTISVVEKPAGYDLIRINSTPGAVHTTWRHIRRKNPRLCESQWDIPPIYWGTTTNSLTSTVTYLWQNPAFRGAPDCHAYSAMLRTPDWHGHHR